MSISSANEQELDNVIRAARAGAGDERTRHDYVASGGNTHERVQQQRAMARQTTRLMSLTPIAAVSVIAVVGWLLFSAVTHKPDVQMRFDKPAANPATGNAANVAKAAAPAPAAPAASTAKPANNAPASSAAAADIPHGLPTDLSIDGQIVSSYQQSGGGDEGAVVIAAAQRGQGSGTAVHATHSGLVKTMRGSELLGNIVYVIGMDYTTIYGYMQSITVTDGQVVKAGDPLGTLGNTGSKAGGEYGLHYEVWKCSGPPAASGTAARQCQNVDPTPYIK